MLSKYLRGGLFLLTISSSALAQDLGQFNIQDNDDYTSPASIDNYIATQAPIPPLSNGYMGLTLGGSLVNLKLETSSTLAPTIPNYSNKTSAFFGNAGLYGGYGTNFNNFYIAGELSGNYNTLYKNVTIYSSPLTGSPKIAVSIRQPAAVALDFIPGYLTDNKKFIFYARFGGALSYTQLKLNITSPTPDASSSNPSTKVLLGYRAGAGVEYFFADAFSMRLDYIYNVYRQLAATYNDIASSASYNYSVKPKNNQINLAFGFHF